MTYKLSNYRIRCCGSKLVLFSIFLFIIFTIVQNKYKLVKPKLIFVVCSNEYKTSILHPILFLQILKLVS